MSDRFHTSTSHLPRTDPSPTCLREEELLTQIRDRRPTPDMGSAALDVQRVLVILTASRSGSSLLKHLLSHSPQVMCLSGEEEPYYVLQGLSPRHDTRISSERWTLRSRTDLEQLRQNLMVDLGVVDPAAPLGKLVQDWQRRLPLQFPNLEIPGGVEKRVTEVIRWGADQGADWDALNERILRSILPTECRPFYDTMRNEPLAQPFDPPLKIEQPPFITPTHMRHVTEEDLQERVALFKTPPDCYRPGIFEQLFPNADIQMLHLSRNVTASVNGLIDGWLSLRGFHSHDVSHQGQELQIEGYSNQPPKEHRSRWWKFDLPPGWEDLKGQPLHEVCLEQWGRAHRHILWNWSPDANLRFEDLIRAPQLALNDICSRLRLMPPQVRGLPHIMTTRPPTPARWRQREDLLLPLTRRPWVRDLMRQLDYNLEPDTWI